MKLQRHDSNSDQMLTATESLIAASTLILTAIPLTYDAVCVAMSSSAGICLYTYIVANFNPILYTIIFFIRYPLVRVGCAAALKNKLMPVHISQWVTNLKHSTNAVVVVRPKKVIFIHPLY
jgi:hypothetical protein